MKAAATRPTRDSMPAAGGPRPCAPSVPAASTATTASDAPEAEPSRKGSASGLRNRPCASAPASPSKAPVSQAPSVRGARIWPTIRSPSGPCSSCMKPASGPALAARRQAGQHQQQAGDQQCQQQPAALVSSPRVLAHRRPGSRPAARPPGPCAGRGAPAVRSRSLGKLHTCCCCSARIEAQPGRWAMSRWLRASAMTMSGCARTTNSGLNFGKGPSDAGTMLRRPSLRQRLADEGGRPGRIGRGLDFEVHAAAAQRGRHARRGLGHLLFDLAPGRLRARRVAEQFGQQLQAALHVLVAARMQHHHLQAHGLEPLDRARRGRGQHQVGLERGDALDLRIVQPAQLGQRLHLRRPVGEAVGADQARAFTERADAFGQRRHQADDALRRRGQAQFVATVVAHPAHRARHAQRQQQQRRHRQTHATPRRRPERSGVQVQSPRPS